MNEHIKDLSNRAEEYAEYYAILSDKEMMSIFKEKYAELILRDCISILGKIGVVNSFEHSIVWAMENATKQIREKYGIES